MRKTPSVLVVDNYDSFVFNLVRYLNELGAATHVVRNDRLDISTVVAQPPSAIVLSPGPCTPAEAGVCEQLVRDFGEAIPILGVCLGHQAIITALRGTLERAPEPVHGRTSMVTHDESALWENVPNPLRVTRYHSLIAEASQLPDELQCAATTDDGIVMAVKHREWPCWGVQFHPESVLTQSGHQILANFLKLAGVPHEPFSSAELDDQVGPSTGHPQPDQVPYFF